MLSGRYFPLPLGAPPSTPPVGLGAAGLAWDQGRWEVEEPTLREQGVRIKG